MLCVIREHEPHASNQPFMSVFHGCFDQDGLSPFDIALANFHIRHSVDDRLRQDEIEFLQKRKDQDIASIWRAGVTVLSSQLSKSGEIHIHTEPRLSLIGFLMMSFWCFRGKPTADRFGCLYDWVRAIPNLERAAGGGIEVPGRARRVLKAGE